MTVTTLDEKIIQDIGHAFSCYDYGEEHGLIDAFPGREAVAAFICGYVRMALQSGMLTLTVLFCGSSAAVYTLLMAV